MKECLYFAGMTASRARLLLLLAFVVSVAVRVPVMNRPLSKHHEFNAAMALNVCQSWSTHGGPGRFNLSPVIHYGNPGDDLHIRHVHVKNGKVHYLSFGPVQFLLPYCAAIIAGAGYTPLLLQILALLLHLLCAWLLWRIVLTACQGYRQVQTAALMAATLFLFTPGTLWFFCNGYVHESVVMPLVLGLVYTYLKYRQRPKTGLLLLMAVIAILGVFTDWLMIFVSAAIGLHSLTGLSKNSMLRRVWHPLPVLLVAVTAAIGLLWWLYGSYFGFDALLNYFKDASTGRQLGKQGAEGGNTLVQIAKHFGSFYALLLPAAAAALRRPYRFRAALKNQSLFVWLFAAALLYFLLFLQFSAEHDYSVLKFGWLLCIMAAFALSHLSLNLFKWATALLLLANTAVFYYINRPGAAALNGDRYDRNLQWARQIRQQTTPDELLVMESNRENRAALIYYAGRNVYQFATEAERDAYFQQSPQPKMCHIRIQGDSLVFTHVTK